MWTLTGGRISCDLELNLVLLRLIEYLGHPNEMVIGVAWNEVGHAGLLYEYVTDTNSWMPWYMRTKLRPVS